MKLIQMIIVSSTYLTALILILAFIQGFIYQVSRKKVSLYKSIIKSMYKYLAINANDRRKLKYTEIEEYRKVG